MGLWLSMGSVAGTLAGPIGTAYPVDGPDDIAAVATAPMGGNLAVADTFQDRVIIRDIAGAVIRTIARAELQAPCPWLNLDGGPDGPSALAFTSSGKQLFISVHDDTLPPDGLGSDAILRYDVPTNSIALMARLDLYDRGDLFPHLGLAHWRAYLYAGSNTGQVRVYLANSASTTGSSAATWTLPQAGPIHALAVDRDTSTLFASNGTSIWATEYSLMWALMLAMSFTSTPGGGGMMAPPTMIRPMLTIPPTTRPASTARMLRRIGCMCRVFPPR